jgi:hypothetical protein
MFLSRSTNTVLLGSNINAGVYERTTSGVFVRFFTSASPSSVIFGVTRGPNGDVYATHTNNTIDRWNSTGALISTTSIAANVSLPINIVWAGNPFPTTAANVIVSGRVMTSSGTGVRGARVTMTDSNGSAKTAIANAFGYFSFPSVASGESYVATVTARGLTFSPRAITVSDSIAGLEIIAD